MTPLVSLVKKAPKGHGKIPVAVVHLVHGVDDHDGFFPFLREEWRMSWFPDGH